MNKKAQTGFYTLMLGIIFFVLGLALAPALNDVIQGDTVRGEEGYDCSNESISSQTKSLCTQTDLIPPLFIGIIFGFAGILLGRVAI